MKIRGVARNDYERGMIFILQHTGMHVSNLVSLDRDDLNDQGWISWRRVKNRKPMRSLIPKGDIMACQIWISSYGRNRRTTRAIQYKIAAIGERAGYPGLSPMSFRAQYAITMLDDGQPPHEVKHMLGCSLDTLMNHYAQIQAARRVMQSEKETCPQCGTEMKPKRDSKTGETFCVNCLDTLRY